MKHIRAFMFFSACLFLGAIKGYGQSQQTALPVAKQNLVAVGRSKQVKPAPSLAASNMVKADRSKPANQMQSVNKNMPVRQQPVKSGNTETK